MPVFHPLIVRAARADTVFVGGGTPSLLESDDVAAILEACREAFDLEPEVKNGRENAATISAIAAIM